jgi:SAM-dependent methyltransferase
MSAQVQEGYYVTEKYASLNRFISYYYQIDAVRRTNPKTVLFVGVGDGLVPEFLKKSGYEVTTLDFDPVLKPDVAGDVRALPFADGSFDTVCVFEVLEHMPFDDSKKALAEIARVAKSHACISVPHRRTGFELVLRFPFIKTLTGRELLRLALYVPVRFPGFAVSKQHYWEIDGRGMTLNRFREALRTHFLVESERTPILDSYRRFFLLEKSEKDA